MAKPASLLIFVVTCFLCHGVACLELSRANLALKEKSELIEYILQKQTIADAQEEEAKQQMHMLNMQNAKMQFAQTAQQQLEGHPLIWPHPALFLNGTQRLVVDPAQFQFETTTPCDDLSAAFQRYKKIFFPRRSANVSNHAATTTLPTLTSVIVTVENISGSVQFGVDETYYLTIPEAGPATILAQSLPAAYHALQTLSQLITFDYDSMLYVIDSAPWELLDSPRFKHREVLVDTSRHFQPLAVLETVLDSFAFGKLNVLHWHIVDSQAFPFDVPSQPELSRNGAWSPAERYTALDIQHIVEYARQRGIRVVVEIDTPGHAASWCGGRPDVCPTPTCLQPLNVASDATFELIDSIFGDITGRTPGGGLFPDSMVHLGGDEVNTTCWTQNSTIMQWLAARGLSLDDGYAYFVNRTQYIVHGQGRIAIGWQEIWDHFGTRLNKDTVIHQWKEGNVIENATSHGYRVIWSPGNVWYLNNIKTNWISMYITDPCANVSEAVCTDLVLGGGGELWGEQVDTSDIIATLWPRLGAISERLWSPASINNPIAASPRLAHLRCLMNQRGFPAAPLWNAQAREPPPRPGGCLTQ